MKLTLRFCCLILAVHFAIGCESTASLTSPSQLPDGRPLQRIAVLGDSLAVSPSRDQGFPVFLQQRLNQAQLPWAVLNVSGRGDTTSDGLRRLDEVFGQNPQILIVAVGANDGLRGVDITIISRNLNEIVERAKQRNVRVLLCGMETPPLRGIAYTLAFHNIFPALAREHRVPLVPFLLAGVAFDPDMNLDDLIHPNAAGARRIAETVWPYLEPMVSE